MIRLHHIAVAAACVLALAAGRAAAQSASAQAEVLFNRGKELMGEGKLAEACASFASSQNLDPTVTTLLNLADCREKNGQLASAWGSFVEAERQTRGSASTRKLNSVAKSRADKLEARLSKLAINIKTKVPGLEVRRGDQPVDTGALGVALPIDGGTYTITARAPSYQEWSTTVTVAVEKDQKSVDVPELEKVGAPTVGVTKPAASTGSATHEEPASHRSLVMPIAFAVGAGAFGAGAVGLELSGKAKYDDALVEPDDAKQESLWKQANTRRYMAVGFASAAVACAGVSVYLFLRKPHAAERTAVAPVASRDSAGVALIGTW